MAPSSRGLVVVLTLWVVAWPATSILTRSAGSGWWGSKEALALRQAARVPTLKGDFVEAERIYRRGADLAAERGDPVARAWFLDGVADARFARFDYRGALDLYLQARQQAERARDRLSLGAIDFDLSSLYQQMWDLDSALRSAEEAREIVQGLSSVYYRPQLQLQLGRLREGVSFGFGAIPLYKEGIEAARAAEAKDPTQIAVEARGWGLLGEALLKSGDTQGAGEAEQKALALRRQFVPRDLAISYWRLGALRLQEHSLKEAESLTRQAMQARNAPPQYLLESQLGRILLEQGRVPEALTAMEAAVAQAQRWRVGIVPSFSVLDGATSELGARIFDGFVEAAVDFGIHTVSRRWIEESFQAAELNRALNFQSTWRRRLPLEYRETLARLQAEEATASPDRLQMERLRLRLTEMEAQAGLGFSLINAENFPRGDSLSLFRHRLRDSEVLLSFGLGRRESFLWAVTRNTLHVYRLPPADRIRTTVQEFRKAIEASRDAPGTEVEDIGGQLYTMLFGQLQTPEASKPAWLLSPEDALLELPFAALVPERDRKGGSMLYLTEKHSLQVIAGALLPEGAPPRPTGGFLAVGDPIYNVADSRWSSPPIGRFWASLTGELSHQLNRLPGSRREMEASALAWGRGSAVVLEGSDATRERFLQSLSPPPQVIHLATHAFTPASGEETYLAFGLGAGGQPEMLDTSTIVGLQVAGSIVVMTGCATAPSDVRTGLGLAGLVRAWTAAGATAVVATEWAVSDSAGSALLSSFYKHLQEAPGSVAEALRLAQVEMIHSGAQASTARAPVSWAAYQVFGSRFGSGSYEP